MSFIKYASMSNETIASDMTEVYLDYYVTNSEMCID